jgi:hypothetical protein
MNKAGETPRTGHGKTPPQIAAFFSANTFGASVTSLAYHVPTQHLTPCHADEEAWQSNHEADSKDAADEAGFNLVRGDRYCPHRDGAKHDRGKQQY